MSPSGPAVLDGIVNGVMPDFTQQDIEAFSGIDAASV
jgi:hypothetical protein